MTESALTVDNLTVRFGGIVALADVSLTVRAGSRHGILGPNGSGKTTLFNAITGMIMPQSGRVLLAGREITRLAPHARVSLGLARTFQITSLFPSLTARENVVLAALPALRRHRGAWRPAADREVAERADRLLTDLGLSHLADRPVVSLGYGEQRQLEIAMTLATRPRVLLLDEPLAGMGPEESERFTHLLKDLAHEHAVLLIEHDMDFVFAVADWMTVMVDGTVLAEGHPADVRANPEVQRAYLGGHA